MSLPGAPVTDTQMYAAGADVPDSDVIPAEPTTIRLSADADADVLLRIAVQLNFLNTAPAKLSLERRRDRVDVIVSLEGCALHAVDLVCRKLAQLTSVLEVSMDPVDPVPIGE
jgi:hypothetical protein